jgi:hypothetical protein
MAPATTTPPIPRPGLRRAAFLLVGAAAAAAGLLGGAFLWAGSGPAADPGVPGDAAAPGRVHLHQHQVGPPQVARLRGGEGTATLRVLVDAPQVPAGRRLAAVPAGAPVTLALDLSAAPGARAPRLVARLMGRPFGPGGPERPVETIDLDEGQMLLVSRRTGEAVAPTLPGSHSSAQPGAGLAQVTGAADRWAVKVSPGSVGLAADPGGHLLAAAYPAQGRVEVVDLASRGRALRIDGLRGVGALAFAPGGRRLWADDPDDGMTVIDARAGRVIARVEGGPGPHAVAFGPAAAGALVTSRDGETATLVDPAGLGARDTAALPAGAVDAVFAPAVRAFVVAHAGGVLTVLPVAAGRLGAPRTIAVGSPSADVARIRVAPDGRTLVAALRGADALALVDLVRGRLVRTVPAGDAPSDVAFLENFAVARNAGSPSLTWVDLSDPVRSNDLALDGGPAADIAPGDDGRRLVVASPARRRAYDVHVMMGRPMVMGVLPNALGADAAVAVPGGLRRTGPGALTLTTGFDRPGGYRLELRLAGGARAAFPLRVVARPAGAARATPARRVLAGRVGEPVSVRFRVTGAAPAAAEALAYSISARQGVRQLRAPARALRDGLWVAALTPTAPGTYLVRLISEEAGIGAGSGPAALLRVAGR